MRVSRFKPLPIIIMKTKLTLCLFFPLLSLGQTKFNPRFIKQSLIQNDTSIINNTDLKIYRLFDTRDSASGIRYFNYPLEMGTHICNNNNNNLTVNTGGVLFTIQREGLHIEQKKDTICKKEIKSTCFKTHRITTTLKSGDFYISYDTTKKYFATQIGKMKISPTSLGCDDTGRNPFKITRNGKSIYFKDIGNLTFFEYDIEKDGMKELYILNSFSCRGRLEIYKIDIK